MAIIPRLAAQWKIIFDLKLTQHLDNAEGWCDVLSMWSDGDDVFSVYLQPKAIELAMHTRSQGTTIKSEQLPKPFEWTRIEIGHEENDGKYLITFSVGGKEVGWQEVYNEDLRKLEDVHLMIGSSTGGDCRGIARGLFVLEKQ